jgi:hypothetical protein
VCTVSCSKGVINIEVTKRGEGLSESVDLILGSLNFLAINDSLAFFSEVEAEVLKQYDLALVSRLALILNL